MNTQEQSLLMHEQWQGKIEVTPRCPVDTKEQLSLAYTPGVAAPCLAIEKDPALSFELTRRGNLVAVITDGTAVLGLGDIGPEAGMPVMEGKCVLFKAFGGVDAIPLCVRTKDVDEIVSIVQMLAGSFGGINLEDIAAPRCFEIERKLKETLDIPVFHDDQHGTAIVAGAALINALRLTNKDIAQVRIVISGAGAAGVAIAKLLMSLGAQHILLTGRHGVLSVDNPHINEAQRELAKITNHDNFTGSLADAMKGADVFIGVSAPGLVTKEMVASMAKDPILFPMANPVPEIFPDEAKEAGAAVVGTGRSDFANQINNVLAFPGIFRGAFDVRAREINDAMCMAATHAIADIIAADELNAEYVIPSPFDKRVGPAVAETVAKAARDSGVARK